MLPVLTCEQSRQLDKAADEGGISPLLLMENAALRAAEVCHQHFELDPPKKVVVVAGKGNNGGDGLTLARHLTIAGHWVSVYLIGRHEEVRHEAAVNLQICLKSGIRVLSVTNRSDLSDLEKAIKEADLVVDAVLGTGVTGAVRGPVRDAIKAMNDGGRPILSIDIPSGIDSDTGRVCGEGVVADATITLGALKWGLVLHPGTDHAGSVFVGSLGVPQSLTVGLNVRTFLTTADCVVRYLPIRSANTHKGDYGRILIVGGSPGMTGAPLLAARAALRSGSGLVMIALPAGLNLAVESSSLEVMSLPVSETEDGRLSERALSDLSGRLDWCDIAAIGCGLSRHPRSLTLVCQLLERLDKPVLVDADGLYALADHPDVVQKRKALTVLTPHPGEMAALLNSTPQKVQEDRVSAVCSAAGNYRAVVVLKGSRTLVAGPDGTVLVNGTGNPGMATAGSGDVLTGLIASVLGQVIARSQRNGDLHTAVEAVATGVFLHGLAGDLATWEKGEWSLTASDLIDHLPRAIMEPELSQPVPLRPLSPLVRMVWRGRKEKGRIGWPVPTTP